MTYSDKINNNTILRTFNAAISDQKLVWHRDHEDRTVKVVKGTNWQFQREDALPVFLIEGDVIKIKKEEWHRLIKGSSDLVLEIKK